MVAHVLFWGVMFSSCRFGGVGGFGNWWLLRSHFTSFSLVCIMCFLAFLIVCIMKAIFRYIFRNFGCVDWFDHKMTVLWTWIHYKGKGQFCAFNQISGCGFSACRFHLMWCWESQSMRMPLLLHNTLFLQWVTPVQGWTLQLSIRSWSRHTTRTMKEPMRWLNCTLAGFHVFSLKLY